MRISLHGVSLYTDGTFRVATTPCRSGLRRIAGRTTRRARFDRPAPHLHKVFIGRGSGCQRPLALVVGSARSMMRPMPTRPWSVSIIVPTFHEAPNIEPLVRRAFAATGKAGIDAEMIVVDDDSRDGTSDIIERLRGEFAVRLIVRHGPRGLSGAVVAGLREARHDRLLVLDADLQHPPEMIPELVKRLDDPACDFVVGTRYAGGSSVAQTWPWYRRIGSWAATTLARPLTSVSDPMSGLFALRRDVWEAAAPEVNAVGYKIGLELYVKGRCHRPVEVPIRFSARAAGKSKLGLNTQIAYLRHLRRLYAFRFRKTVWALQVTLIGAAVYILFVLLRSR